MRGENRPHVIPALVRAPMVLDDPQRWIGDSIADRYRAEELLGMGPSGAVLRCHHIELDLEVAVKLMHPEIARTPAAVSGFLALAQETSRLDHPNCAQVLDFGEWRRTGAVPIPYVTTPFAPGDSLAALVLVPTPPQRAIELVRQVVDGLAHAHGRGLVHGHVAPSNVLRSKDGKGTELLKLVDFGHWTLAERARRENPAAIAARVDAMPHYATPELATGAEADARTDLYGVGLLLHHLLCGVPTFDAEDPPHLLSLHAFADPPALPQTIPAQLRRLVSRLLAKSPNDRPQSAAELARDLDQAMTLFTRRRTMQFGSAAMAAIARSLAPVSKLEQGSRPGAGAQHRPTPVKPPADASSTVRLPERGPEFGHPTMELRSPTMRLPNLPDEDTMPSMRRHPKAWIPIGAAAIALLGAVGWVATGTEEAPTRASTESDFAGIRSVIAARFGKQSAKDATAPAPAEPRASQGGVDGELDAIDTLLRKGQGHRAMARIDRMLREHRDDARVHLRRARALALREEDGARALAAYDDALGLDPQLLEDEATRAEIMKLVHRTDLRAPALELVLHQFGAHRDRTLAELVNDGAAPLGYRDRHRALAAITEDSTQAVSVDHVLATTLDLWQAGESDEPCLVFASALANVELAPSPAYLGSLHRVTPPLAAADADANTKALCAVLPARLQAVKSTLDAQFPVSPSRWTIPAAYQPRARAAADATPAAISPDAALPPRDDDVVIIDDAPPAGPRHGA